MRVTLGEGHTPIEDWPDLASWAGLDELRLKREDLNPTGSHKDRGAARQITRYVGERRRVAVISSSGNAALSAATYGQKVGIRVVALVSPLTPGSKVDQVAAAGARVVVTTKPINYALRLARVRRWPDLRPSISEEALNGFRGLGRELSTELVPGMAVFGYASSGTTYQALGETFAGARAELSLHPVQAGLVNGLAAAFGRAGDGRRSLVGDLGVKVSSRTDAVVALVRASGGQAWWVNDTGIEAARDALSAAGLDVAPECWAALAGAREAARSGRVRRACLVLTGRAVPGGSQPVGESRGPVFRSFLEVLDAVSDLP